MLQYHGNAVCVLSWYTAGLVVMATINHSALCCTVLLLVPFISRLNHRRKSYHSFAAVIMGTQAIANMVSAVIIYNNYVARQQ